MSLRQGTVSDYLVKWLCPLIPAWSCGPYLQDIGTGRQRVLNSIDGEDNIRQGVDG